MNNDTKELKAEFAIKIDFDKNSENPSRIFEATSQLIKSFEKLDKDLANCIDVRIEPILLLEDIKTGSLTTWLTDKIKGVPDDVLKSGDYKKAIGHYLVKGKYILIKFLERKTQITDIDIKEVQYELLEAANQTEVNQIPSYSMIQPKQLLENIKSINDSVSMLDKKDKVEYISDVGNATFNLQLYISPENIEELITRESIESESLMILKIKKPDYLGDSMWEFKYDNRTINVKILDTAWLQDFQNRKIDVRPKDAIRARVKIKVDYGYDSNVVNVQYEALEVIEVIPNLPPNQQQIFE